MAANFREILRLADNEIIIDEDFLADSVEQILQCKPEGVLSVDAVKVREIGQERVSNETVWL